MFGDRLGTYNWTAFVPGDSPSLVASGPETIQLSIAISEDMQDLHATLYSITYALSSITSQNLHEITPDLQFKTDECTIFDVNPAVSDFLQANPLASILSRDILIELAPVIHLQIDEYSENRSTILDAAVRILPTLFEPWKAHGKLEVSLPYAYMNQ
ncbi:hypothetical protein DAEQUDRAFT_770346 [Daedalea quercina L-15889]|uniref:Uncharacterized protein n=1 Tax=Daedalea quercina L-15889 TaxID=1314783 RepID=A0A165KXK7_9APHY|nr:hypothetical protein DAEQUDRAFT_770346 [Daedalea quercina L-15889]